jgi:hypothetical protein
MLTYDEAQTLAEEMSSRELFRTTSRFDQLLREGLGHEQAMIMSVEEAIVRIAEKALREPSHDRRPIGYQRRARP